MVRRIDHQLPYKHASIQNKDLQNVETLLLYATVKIGHQSV